MSSDAARPRATGFLFGLLPAPAIVDGRPAAARHSRLRLAAVLVTAAVLSAVLLPPRPLHAAPEKRPLAGISQPEDFAGVYLDRYIPPGNHLRLKPGGKKRSRALADYYLGLLKEAEGDFTGALEFFFSAVEADPSAVPLANRAAFIAAQNGDPERGRAILQRALETNPDNIECYLGLSDFIVTFFEDDPKLRAEAVQIIRKGLARHPANTDLIEHLVKTLVADGDTDGAREFLEKTLARPSKNARFWLSLGRIAQHVWPLGDDPGEEPARINEIYERALSLANKNLGIAEAVADFYHASAQHQRAREIYLRIIGDHPKCISPREKLARIYALDDDMEKVVEILSELIEIHPERPETQKFLASIYEDRKEYEKAIHHYQQALRISQGTISDYFYASRLMLNVENFREAVNLLERARFHYPESGDITRLLAFAYAFNKQYPRAITTFEETIRLVGEGDESPLDEAFYFQYAASCERDGQLDRAEELFRKSIGMVPQDTPELAAKSYNYLGYMWLEQDTRIDEAGEMIIKANNLKPDTGAYLDSLGWFHFKKGDYQAALEDLLRAAELIGLEEQEPDPVVFDHIAQTYFQLGDKPKAIDYLEKAIAADPENEDFTARLEEFKKARPAGNPPKDKTPVEKEPSKLKPAA